MKILTYSGNPSPGTSISRILVVTPADVPPIISLMWLTFVIPRDSHRYLNSLPVSHYMYVSFPDCLALKSFPPYFSPLAHPTKHIESMASALLSAVRPNPLNDYTTRTFHSLSGSLPSTFLFPIVVTLTAVGYDYGKWCLSICFSKWSNLSIVSPHILG